MQKNTALKETPFREIHLTNGLMVRFYDLTRRYYGDFYLVKLEVRCEVPIRRAYIGSADEFARVKALLGESVLFRRTIERMGVPTAKVGEIRELLMTNFEQHASAYLVSASFPHKLIMSQLHKARRSVGLSSNGISVHA